MEQKFWVRWISPNICAYLRHLRIVWFLVDKLVAGGLDDWEVKIADFGVLLGKDAKKVFDATD